ncbi:MAG: N-6 DNA methylase [Myxococcota bacterium]
MADASERFARELRAAEERLRAAGLGGRRAFVALVRHLAARLGLARELWPEGPDAPASARLDALPLPADLDLFGLAYERFFTDLFKGARGQYFTPRPLVELVADLAAIRPGERVLDPTCGSGGFLVAGIARGGDVDGVEVDPDLVALARLNVALHGGNPRAVVPGDVFRDVVEERWDVILANPPFSVDVEERDVLARYELGQGRARVASDALFVEAAMRRLRPGGRLVTVLPRSVLSGAATAQVRAFLDRVAVREAVVSLPEGVFRPFGGTPTRACVVALRKRPAKVAPALLAVVDHPGFDPRRKSFRRSEPDELAALRLHLRGGAAYRKSCHGDAWVPDEAIAADGVADGVPTFVLGEHAELVRGREPIDRAARYTVIDLADVDKGTGEVVDARVLRGEDVEGGAFEEGDLLFGRMRPELNNVVRATRPRAGLPARLAGSGEWVRFRPGRHGDFLLLAMRSRFARAQLPVTGGQTRPRARAEDIAALRLPDPGESARAELDATLRSLRAERLRLRKRLDEIDALYDKFGRGELTAWELEARVRAMRRS